jgi:hypothetical protein
LNYARFSTLANDYASARAAQAIAAAAGRPDTDDNYVGVDWSTRHAPPPR